MRNIRLIIEYDGTEYVGWQRQPSGRTVQEEIERALESMTGERTVVNGSGRTDSGVHALGQTASFRTGSPLGPLQIQRGLNSLLPPDIAILRAEETDPSFHAQHSAKRKTYVYKILNRQERSAMLRDRVWHVYPGLDADAMKEAARALVGEHDFKAFAHAGITVRSTVRTVFGAEVVKEGDFITFTIEADGFLKRMVRLLAGTLAEVGKGKITPEDFADILARGEKTKHVHAAPARGLYLKEVLY
ncbi:MAG: tRNA pseudouridine(38-40) synthase TruA [Candidatus Dadabacteria bacterium]|nr:tRNA pseudouridine(38-40) synthase TruA [Candidatus Dadabacteria bacterium]